MFNKVKSKFKITILLSVISGIIARENFITGVRKKSDSLNFRGTNTKDLADVIEAQFKFLNDKQSTRFKVAYDVESSEENKAIVWAFRAIWARRIVGGMETSISTYPYNVAISRSGRHWCGGAIIDEQWVLTAGHCMEPVYEDDKFKLQQYLVRAGSSYHDRGGYQARINRVFFPPEYVPGSADYDYSLLRLDRPLPIGKNIAVLNLPSKDYVIENDDMLIVTGWGSTHEAGFGNIPDRLRFVPVPVMSNSACQKSYKFYITPRMVCAGYATGGKDACNHDSGGPAVKDGVLLGVVSFGGKKCGDPASPGVYSRVSEVTNWVQNTVTSNEADKVPELRHHINKAREQETKIQKFKSKVENKKAIIKNWLKEIFKSSKFLEIAKRHFFNNRKSMHYENIDQINFNNQIIEKIIGDVTNDSELLLQVLALQGAVYDDELIDDDEVDDDAYFHNIPCGDADDFTSDLGYS